ncbi:MAG: NAD/NADP octopine/nopaline dehydrogenase family protein [Candidatus Bathyarchaeia archaeon]
MKFAVLGAGNAGYAQAADLSLAGYDVALYELPKFKKNIEPIIKKGGIEITGVARNGFAELKKITTNVREATKDAKVIFITVPAFAHEVFFKECAPYLEDDQIILIDTSYYACLRLARLAKELGIKKNIILSETSILVYSCRISGPAEVHVDGYKNKDLKVSAFPAKNTPTILDLMKEVYPQLIPAKNVLECDLENLNPCSHTSITILNSARIELTKGNFNFYSEGTTPAVGKVIDSVDYERRKVGDAFGLEIRSYVKTMKEYYNSKGESAYEVIQTTDALKDPREKAPSDFTHRYMTEDIPYGLVPISSLGKLANVPTPTIDSLIQLASVIAQVDYGREGATLERLGIEGLSVRKVNELLMDGSIQV